MISEYILYYDGKVVGGVYDNRLLLKPTLSAKVLIPNAEHQPPYKGVKEMLLVENVENIEFIEKLFGAMYYELPELKKRKSR